MSGKSETRAEDGPAPLRCVVADDHPAVLDAVSRFLSEEEGLELAGRATDGTGALGLIDRRRPDVALLDIRMSGLSGIDVARQVADTGVATAVILYTGSADRALLLEALDAGARGFLLKEAPLQDLSRAIKIVAAGGTYVDAALAGMLTGPAATERLPALTQREREILRLLADGMHNDAVAARLSISPHTVHSHVRNAMQKLEADTRTQAVASALRQSLIT